ncbi:MAG: hypothetical protein JSR97_00655 [Verrucomicrobia bacterium]|nr:hypothetical protein [Verrucomicrobiota bacterium]
MGSETIFCQCIRHRFSCLGFKACRVKYKVDDPLQDKGVKEVFDIYADMSIDGSVEVIVSIRNA